MANGETVGGYFQIDINILRDSNNNPISINNISIFMNKQKISSGDGTTISEGYVFQSLYQTVTVGETYVFGVGNTQAFHLSDGSFYGNIVKLHASNDCNAGCSEWGFQCNDEAQRFMAGNISNNELQLTATSLGLGTGTIVTGDYSPGVTWGYELGNSCRNYRIWLGKASSSYLENLTCTSPVVPLACGNQYCGWCTREARKICFCGGWKIPITI